MKVMTVADMSECRLGLGGPCSFGTGISCGILRLSKCRFKRQGLPQMLTLRHLLHVPSGGRSAICQLWLLARLLASKRSLAPSAVLYSASQVDQHEARLLPHRSELSGARDHWQTALARVARSGHWPGTFLIRRAAAVRSVENLWSLRAARRRRGAPFGGPAGGDHDPEERGAARSSGKHKERERERMIAQSPL